MGLIQFLQTWFSKMWKTDIAEYCSKFSSIAMIAFFRSSRCSGCLNFPSVSSKRLDILVSSQITTITHAFTRFSNVIFLKPVNTPRSAGPSSSYGSFFFFMDSGILFEGSIHAGHYTLLVRSKDDNNFRRFNVDSVFDIRKRNALNALKHNRFGFPHGVIYIREG